MKTEQEHFWPGEFARGDMERNQTESLLAANCALFAKILSRTQGVGSILKLVDYGFVWRRDSFFPQDDITWVLMQKRS